MAELFLLGVGRGDLGDQDLGLGGNLDTGELGHFGGSHAGMRWSRAPFLNIASRRASKPLALLDKVAAAAGELLFDLLVDAIDDGHGLLGGADHTVVERLGVDHRADRQGSTSAGARR